MQEFYPGFAEASWPAPADRSKVELGLPQWQEAITEHDERVGARRARAIATDPDARRLLLAIFGNSPYLTHCLLREPGFAIDLLTNGPDAAVTALFTDMTARFARAPDMGSLMAGLRIAKRRTALAIALADIAGLWALERVTAALSDFADLSLDLAVRHLLAELGDSGAVKLPYPDDPCRDSGLAIIAMGKLGARELNYSSDIDIIVLYDDEKVVTDQPDALQHRFVRLTRGLVKILQESTAEGYVLRTDLRLRPDPGSTPPAMSTTTALIYYESFGQNWERAAMIKARPVAGDRAAGAAFLAQLRPYVWRKHLDFAAIQDIHSIKRQIHAHHGGAVIRLGGHNIKIGRGGIREIEFFAQTQQLIWGGRQPSLRVPATCDALAGLVAVGRVEAKAADELTEAYRFLRRVEHRLQMIDDKQTHSLPAEGPALDALATFLGFADTRTFADRLLGHLRRVEHHYARLFEQAPTLSGPGNLVFTGTEDDPGTIETLAKLGFVDCSQVASTIRGWHHGRVRAMRSTRAREILTELMPTLLQALARTPQPDAAFLKFDEFLSRLPAGVQIFSLLHANPGLLDLVAEIMGGAPRLADTLAKHTHLLDSVLSDGFFAPPPDLEGLVTDLKAVLSQARDFQDVLDLVRRWNAERRFQVGVQFLRGVATPEATGAALADIAECVLVTLLPAVEADFVRQHGRLSGAEFVIVALGKLGGREMTMTSDLDLIFIYDVPRAVDISDGERPLPPPLYYTRLSNRFINAVTALTGEGRLYEVDMRLRPSGAKGPIATSRDGFVSYGRDSAWTWEHMALTRARPITGSAEFGRRVSGAIREILTRPRGAPKLVADIADMRGRIAREHPPRDPWDVKYWRGGLIDVEFIAQYLQLRHAADAPGILAVNTRQAIENLVTAGFLPASEGKTLLDALHLWQAIQGMLRVTLEGKFDAAAASPALAASLVRAAGTVDFARLESSIHDVATRVMAIFERLLPPPAEDVASEPARR